MAKFEAPIIRDWDFMMVWIFERIRRFVWENVAGEQDLALQKHFPYESSKFSENSNYGINLLVFSWGLKLGLFGIFDVFFPFLAFFKL